MPELPDVRSEPLPYQQLIDRLTTLSTTHLLYFRIEVGRAVAEELDLDDAGANLRAFAVRHASRLEDLGLTEGALRQSVRAFRVVEGLPAELVQRLVFSHVVELARVEDPATRALLARAAADEGWSGRQLRDAVLSARAGLWVDGDTGTPGLQPVAPPPPPPRRATGWVVSRMERRVGDFAEVADELDALDPAAMTPLQQARVRKALDDLDAKLARARSKLGSPV